MNSTTKAALVSAIVFTVIIALFFVFWDGGEAPPAPALLEDVPIVDDSVESAPNLAKKGPYVDGLVPRDAVKLSVEVVDGGSGRALPKARLSVSQLADGQHVHGVVWDSTRQGVSRDGRFEVTLAPGAYELHAQCLRFSGERREITVVKDQPQNIVIELDQGTSISGRILDGNNRGIGGARVLALKDISAPDASLEELLLGLIDLEKMTSEEALASETVSAEDGTYQLDGLHSSASHGTYYTVRATAAGHTPGEEPKVPAPREKVDLVLARGGIVSGVVVGQAGRVTCPPLR